MVSSSLKNRMYGYQLSGSEYRLIFEKENMGYVRFMDVKNGIFYLDPSPFLNTPYNEVYVIKNKQTCEIPPKGKLIEATVRETETINKIEKNEIHSTLIKYVTDWKFEDPNKIRSNRLVNKEEFLDYLTTPMTKRNYNIEDIGYCLGLYTISSPQLTDFEPGGINTVVLGKSLKQRDWNTFKRITSIVPKEFRNVTSRNFYKSLETPEQPCPVNSSEINLAYFNIKEVPIHVPLLFEGEFKSYASYKDDIKHLLPMARAFMLDALLFQPEIPVKLQRRVEEAMYFVMDEIIRSDMMPCQQDIGSVIPKLTTSFARLNSKPNVTLDDLNAGKNLWTEVMTQTRKTISNGDKTRKSSKQTSDEIQLLEEIKELKDIGVPLTMENIKKHTNVFEWNFEKALKNLSTGGYIYYKCAGTIGVIEF